MRFRGKIAPWWYAIVILIAASSIWLAAQSVTAIVTSNPETAILIISTLVFIFFDVFMIDSCIRNYVDLSENSLRVRVSVFSETVPYSKITLIKETNSAWASLSTSLDRINIRYGLYTDVLIAVKDKETFLEEIHRMNLDIPIERKPR